MTNQPRTRKRRHYVFAGIALIAACGIALVLVDLVVFWWDQRHPHPLAQAAVQPSDKTPPIYEETTVGYRLRRFLDQPIIDPISRRETRYRSNALGFRGGPVAPKAAGVQRILVLGDSITLAPYLEESETYPAVIEASLRAKGLAAEAINAGLSGACIRDELLILNETGLLAEPDVVVLGMFLNDATRSRMFVLPESLLAHSALARRMMTQEFVNEAVEDNRAEYERLSGKPYPTTVYPAEAWRTDRAAFDAEVAAVVIDWGAAWFPWSWNEMRPDLDILRSLSVKHDFQLLVVLFPARVQIEATFLDDRPQAMWKQLMVELDLPHLDLLPVLRAGYERTGEPQTYDHCHLRPSASRLVGDAIADRILDMKF